MSNAQPTHTVALENQLSDDLSNFYADMLGFVMYAYPWDTDPSLQLVRLPEPWSYRFDSEYGPDAWACELMDKISRQVLENKFDGREAVAAIQEAIASGHGIGKSAFVAWFVDWVMSTRPYAQGTVTANTGPQLETKTWAQIAKWTKMCVTAHWFNITTGKGSMAMRHKEHPTRWYCTAQTCREENSESFAGQHAADSTSFYVNDEASGIPAAIWEVQEGGMTDGEPMRLAFGNPTRNTGKFSDIFGIDEKRWGRNQIDSRSVQITNKEKIQEWVDDYGEDSDFVRVRVRGEFPNASDLQLIGGDIVQAARKREAVCLPDDPLCVGIDIARGGKDNNTIRARKGKDARTFPSVKVPGELTRDTMRFVAKIIEYLHDLETRFHRADAIFIDATGLGGPVADRLRQMGYHVIDVQFASKATNPKYANKRTEMWVDMRDWIRDGGAIPDEPVLARDLTAPEYHHNRADQLQLESKEDMKARGIKSPDDGDALGLTLAFRVAPRSLNAPRPGQGGVDTTTGRAQTELKHDYDPYA